MRCSHGEFRIDWHPTLERVPPAKDGLGAGSGGRSNPIMICSVDAGTVGWWVGVHKRPPTFSITALFHGGARHPTCGRRGQGLSGQNDEEKLERERAPAR